MAQAAQPNIVPPTTHYIDYLSTTSRYPTSHEAPLHDLWQGTPPLAADTSRLIFVTFEKKTFDKDKNHYGICPICKPHFKEAWHLPEFLFDEACLESNGYVREIFSGDDIVQHFRCLVKQLTKEYQKNPLKKYKDKTYQWYEMTFTIRSQPNGPTSIVGFGVPPTFHTTFAKALGDMASDPRWTTDSERITAVLLQEIVNLYDQSVWSNSKAVRSIEKVRDKHRYSAASGYDFPALHELHRHIIHTSEVLQVVVNSLKELTRIRLAKEKAVQKQLVAIRTINKIQNLSQDDDDDGTKSQQSPSAPTASVPSPTAQASSPTALTSLPIVRTSSRAPSINLSPNVQGRIAALLPTDITKLAPLSDNMREHYDFCSQLLQSFALRSQANVSRLGNEITFATGSASIDLGLSAQKDAASMRKIAFVTLLFLPATFVATLYGMSFYNYSGQAWTTAKDIWRFWAIAAPLTVACALFWWFSQLLEDSWWPIMKYWPGISKLEWRWRTWRIEREMRREDEDEEKNDRKKKDEEKWKKEKEQRNEVDRRAKLQEEQRKADERAKLQGVNGMA